MNFIQKIGKFLNEMVRDDNTLNEKIIIGIISFIMMVITLGVDIYTGIKGYKLPIHEFVYDGFVYIVLGAFGIAAVGQIWGKKGNNGE